MRATPYIRYTRDMAAVRDTCARRKRRAPGRCGNRILFDRLVGIWGTVSCCHGALHQMLVLVVSPPPPYTHYPRCRRGLRVSVSGKWCRCTRSYVCVPTSLRTVLITTHTVPDRGKVRRASGGLASCPDNSVVR